MSATTSYKVDDLIPQLSKRMGGLQALEVKEIALFPTDSTRTLYGCKYKNWNVGAKAAPIVVYVNRGLNTDYTLPATTYRDTTPYVYSVDNDGVVKFNKALLVTDQVMAGFSWRLFTEQELNDAMTINAANIIGGILPITIDTESIAYYLVEVMLIAAQLHLYQGLMAEQNLYYNYSLQDQSHQAKQVKDNLKDTIMALENSLKDKADSILWYRLQGKARSTLSQKVPYTPSDALRDFGGTAGYATPTLGQR